MAKPVLSFLDYLKAAWDASPAIPGMGKIPVNKLAVFGAATLGFLNPGFWFVGAALETFYLYSLSTNPNFQKYVQSLLVNVIQQDQAGKINAMIMSLDQGATDRLNHLNLNLAEVNKLMDLDSGDALEFVKENKQRTLGQLPILFLKLLVTKSLTTQSLQRTDAELLKVQQKDLQKQLETPGISEALARSARGTLEILEKRLENLKRAKENLQLIEMELNRIENQIQLVREEVALNRTPEAISSSIDRINSTLGETERWIDTHSEFFTRMHAPEAEAAPGAEAPAPSPEVPVEPPKEPEQP